MKLSAITTTAGAGGGGGDGVELSTGNQLGHSNYAWAIGTATTNVSCSANTWTQILNLTGPGLLCWLRFGSTDPNTVVHDVRMIVDGETVLNGSFTIANFNMNLISSANTAGAPVAIKYKTSLIVEYRSTKTHSVQVDRQALGVK